MKGKVAIVTGANSALGIGRATVHQFAQNGAKAIYICDYNDENLETHKRELNSLYPDVDIHPRSFDAADEPAVAKVCEEAHEKYGRLDVFFANAGIASGAIFTETTTEDFMEMMRVNTLRYVDLS
jgi:NAD(P)-dependent dehydrogenase (short-subunit alcohol dehydrogenase family)